MAGELRRFWPLAATLALATGIGPAHPDVCGIAAALAARLPCLDVRVAHGSPAPIGELLRMAGARVSRLSVAVVVTRLQAGAGGVALRGALALDPIATRSRSSLATPTAALTRTAAATSLLARAAEAGLRVVSVPELVSPISPGKISGACVC